MKKVSLLDGCREVTCAASAQTEGEARPLLDGCREVTCAASAQTEGDARPLLDGCREVTVTARGRGTAAAQIEREAPGGNRYC